METENSGAQAFDPLLPDGDQFSLLCTIPA